MRKEGAEDNKGQQGAERASWAGRRNVSRMGRDEGPPGEPGLVCDEVEERRGGISFGVVRGRWDGGHGPTLVSV